MILENALRFQFLHHIFIDILNYFCKKKFTTVFNKPMRLHSFETKNEMLT